MSIANLSTHFTYREGTYSATARDKNIDNNPNPVQLEAMKYTALKMEAVRQLLDGRPLYISSWFRSAALNEAIRGAKNSQHSRGEAVDFKCPGWGSVKQVASMLQQNKELLQYDQLILEPTWVHISFVQHTPPRKNDLTYIGPGKYSPGIG
ncbi:Peptidase M15 [compost metagenome]